MKLPSTPEEWAEFHAYFRIRDAKMQATAPRALLGRTDIAGRPIPATPHATARSMAARQIRWRCPWMSRTAAMRWANDLIAFRSTGVVALPHAIKRIEWLNRPRRRQHA